MSLSRSQKIQLEFLSRIVKLTPAPYLMGGIAEDAVLWGAFSREHTDIDLAVSRNGLKTLLNQLSELGFSNWETWGENATGEPFYLSKQVNGLLVDIGVIDSDDQNRPYLELGRLHFQIMGKEPPTGYRVYLPSNIFSYSPILFEGICVYAISPLANYQIRAGIASQGSFGQLRPKDLLTISRLRAKFFPNNSEVDLMPIIEKVV